MHSSINRCSDRIKSGRILKAAIAASLVLSGCVFQPTLMNMKFAADVVSYATTKKSTNDNIASAVTEKDCDTFNLLENGKSYCRVKMVYQAPPRGGLTATWRKSDYVMERDNDRNVATTDEERKPLSAGNRVLLATHRADRPRSGLHKNLSVRPTKKQVKRKQSRRPLSNHR